MRLVTAGESHGERLTAILDGVPAGLRVDPACIDADLARRQGGWGRSARQSIEHDRVKVTAGLRFGETIGSPICLEVANRDWDNRRETMEPFGEAPDGLVRETRPRPGHADLVGVLKHDRIDCRDVLERASARTTAVRVAAGGIARELLAELGVEVSSYVVRIGDVALETEREGGRLPKPLDVELMEMRCPDAEVNARMMAAVEEARSRRETLGGAFRVTASGLVPGLGSYDQAENRLTSKLAAAVFGIPAIKSLDFGIGRECAELVGSLVHDEIVLRDGAFSRTTNRAGGLEGGMSTGERLVLEAVMKPIPTLANPLRTVDLDTLEPASASTERSDVCAVPSCAVVAEAEVALVLAAAYLDKFAADCMSDLKASVRHYRERLATMAR